MASRLTEAAAQILLEYAVHHDRSFDAPRKSLKEKRRKKKITARMTMLENALILLSSTERGKQATFFSTKLTHSKSDCYSVGVREA